MTRLLLTGFGPFPSAPLNPSAQIVQALAVHPPDGLSLVTHILPVIWRDAQIRIAALIRETRPDAILHLGLATKRISIGVETRARNACSRLHPDAEDTCRISGTIDPRGSGIRHARLDCASIVATLRKHRLDAELSDDAGDYICNETLYLSLGSDVPRVGFIHVPMPDVRMSLQAMTDGLADVLRLIARS